jgi:hypothetical protein
MRTAMTESGGKKTFLGLVLSGLALLAALVTFVVYGLPVGGNTNHLNIGMPKQAIPKKN